MASDRILRVTFVFSLLTHGAILLQSPNLNPFFPPPKEQKIKVRYLKKEELASKLMPKQLANSRLGKPLSKSDLFLKLDAKIGTGNKIPPPYVQFTKPIFASPDFMAIKKKITLPAIEMAKIDNPSYISYYQIVREKIRRSAYQNYTHNEIGEVYISFIISNDGLIKGVRLVEEKSSINDYLRSTALRSVNDASPFPNFPKELDYPQLSFNIIISFEIE